MGTSIQITGLILSIFAIIMSVYNFYRANWKIFDVRVALEVTTSSGFPLSMPTGVHVGDGMDLDINIIFTNYGNTSSCILSSEVLILGDNGRGVGSKKDNSFVTKGGDTSIRELKISLNHISNVFRGFNAKDFYGGPASMAVKICYLSPSGSRNEHNVFFATASARIIESEIVVDMHPLKTEIFKLR
jgi:hypothetical protein